MDDLYVCTMCSYAMCLWPVGLISIKHMKVALCSVLIILGHLLVQYPGAQRLD